MPQQVQRLRAVPLPAVLLAAGAAPDRDDKARWHTATGTISVTGCKFFNWNRGCGGGGAIDLVIHLYGLDFSGAVGWLDGRFPAASRGSASCAAPKQPLKLPLPAPRNLSTVIRYLTVQRRIPAALLNRLIASGSLYADARANAVFLLLGKRNTAVGAELRGTGPKPWRGMAPGSRKNQGYFFVRDSRIDAIILCESAIDAISCLLIHPHRSCISTAGARPNPSWLPAIIHNGLPIYCGFDADSTGDDIAEAMIERYPAIKRLRPPRHDWNELLKSLS
jgi:hypothetical protein